jgi:hypothetical protein
MMLARIALRVYDAGVVGENVTSLRALPTTGRPPAIVGANQMLARGHGRYDRYSRGRHGPHP